jgi:hypothetical protein
LQGFSELGVTRDIQIERNSTVCIVCEMQTIEIQ